MYVAQQNIYACYTTLHYLTSVLKACGAHTHMHAYTYTHTNPVFQRAQLPELHRWRTATWRADPDSPPRQTCWTHTHTHTDIYSMWYTEIKDMYSLHREALNMQTERERERPETGTSHRADVYHIKLQEVVIKPLISKSSPCDSHTCLWVLDIKQFTGMRPVLPHARRGGPV